MDDRERILSRLPEPKGGARPSVGLRVRTVPESDLWRWFEERLSALGGEVRTLDSVAEFSGRRIYDEDVPQHVKHLLGEPVTSVWDAEAGVVMADLAVAETGSLLIAATKGRARLNSLAPPVNAVLVRQADIVASLDEALGRLDPRTSVLVTGPSRTADIEGVLVRGIHGPKSLWAVPIP